MRARPGANNGEHCTHRDAACHINVPSSLPTRDTDALPGCSFTCLLSPNSPVQRADRDNWMLALYPSLDRCNRLFGD
jgi:hypothetical protein